MAEFQLPENWTEWRPHAQRDAVRAPGVMKSYTAPGQGGSSGSAEPQGSSGRAPMSFSTPSPMGPMGGRTQMAEERPYPMMSREGLLDFGSRWFGGAGLERQHVPGAVTPPNVQRPAPQPRPMPTSPQRMSAMDVFSLLADVPHGVTRYQPPTPTTPPALSPLEFVQHGTGPAYPLQHGMGLPLPGRTP